MNPLDDPAGAVGSKTEGPHATVTPDIGRLLLSCRDRHGIVAAVSGFLADVGANIVTSDQFSSDPEGGAFFLRIQFHLPELDKRRAELEQGFAEISAPFGMRWRLSLAGERSASGCSPRATTTACSTCCGAGAAGSWSARSPVSSTITPTSSAPSARSACRTTTSR